MLTPKSVLVGSTALIWSLSTLALWNVATAQSDSLSLAGATILILAVAWPVGLWGAYRLGEIKMAERHKSSSGHHAHAQHHHS